MKFRKEIGIFLVFFSFIFVIFLPQSVKAWTIDDNSVYVNNSLIFINVTPHTLHDSGWIHIELLSKKYSGDIDVVFGFNTSYARPKKAFLYKPHYETVIKSYTCNPPHWYNYTLNPKHFWCWDTVCDYNNQTKEKENCTDVLLFDHDFETYDLETNTTYWTESVYKEWKDVSRVFNSFNFDFQGMNKWYYTQSVPIEANKMYKFKAWVSVRINSKGKYWVAFKPSDETLEQAILNNHFYYLDPWWNSNWQYRRNITVTEQSGTSLTNYVLGINVTYDSDMASDFSDIRFVDSNNNELSYWLEDKSNGNWAYFWVKIPSIPSSGTTTISMYYGNTSVVSSQSNGQSTFPFFDDFDDGTLNTTKWDEHTYNADDSITEENGYVELLAQNVAGHYTNLRSRDNTTQLKYSWVETFGKWKHVANNDMYMVVGKKGTESNAYDQGGFQTGVKILYTASSFYIQKRVDGGTTTLVSESKSPPSDWTKFRILANTSVVEYHEGDDAYVKSGSYNDVFSDNDILKPSLITYKGTARWDWIATREVVYPEPTYSVGNEETSGPDTTPPTWSSASHNNTEVNEPTKFQITVNDNTALHPLGYWIFSSNLTGTWENDTAVNFTSTPETISTVKILPSDMLNKVIGYRWYLYDNASQVNTTPIFTLTVVDTKAPQWFNNQTTGSLTYDPNEQHYHSVTWSDNYETQAWTVGYFESNFTGTWKNYTASRSGNATTYTFVPPAGTYCWRFWAKDSSENWNVTDMWCKHINKASPTLSLTFDPTSPITYETQSKAYCQYQSSDSGYTLKLFRNETDVTSENNVYITLPAGTWKYKCNVSETQNYTSGETSSYYTVNKKTPPLDITFSPSSNVYYPTETTVQGINCPSQLTCNFYRNETSVANPDIQTLPVGKYLYVYNTSGNENYTSATVEKYLTVSESPEISTTEYYKSKILEGEVANFTLLVNISDTDFWWVNESKLIWNNTIYNGTFLYNTSDTFVFNALVPIPKLNTSDWNESVSFHWNYTAWNTTPETKSTTTKTQTIYKIALTDCSYLTTTKTLIFEMYNETNQTAINASLDINFEIWKNSSVTRNYAFSFKNNHNYSVCIYPSWASLYTNAIGQFYTNIHPTREYNLHESLISNQTQTIKLYLVGEGESTRIKLTVKDASGTIQPDVFIQIQRYYIDSDSYVTVAIPKTDSLGQTSVNLIPYTVYYKFVLIKNGQVVAVKNPMLITSSEIILTLDPVPKIEYLKYTGKIAHGCIFNNETKTLSCTVVDTSGTVTKGYLNVYWQTVLNRIKVCSASEESSSFTIGCNLGSNANGTYSYVLSVDTDLNPVETVVLESDLIQISVPMVIFGLEGIIAAILIIGTNSFIGLFNPAAGILLGLLSFGICLIFGIIPPLWSAFFSLLFVGIIIIIKAKT